MNVECVANVFCPVVCGVLRIKRIKREKKMKKKHITDGWTSSSSLLYWCIMNQTISRWCGCSRYNAHPAPDRPPARPPAGYRRTTSDNDDMRRCSPSRAGGTFGLYLRLIGGPSKKHALLHTTPPAPVYVYCVRCEGGREGEEDHLLLLFLWDSS